MEANSVFCTWIWGFRVDVDNSNESPELSLSRCLPPSNDGSMEIMGITKYGSAKLAEWRVPQLLSHAAVITSKFSKQPLLTCLCQGDYGSSISIWQEAWVVYDGLHVVVLKGWCDLDAECDCLQVINILSHGSPSLFYFGAITESCLAINSSFSSIIFHFVRRSDNVLAQWDCI